MEFPIAIHKDEGSVYGVSVPDIPGCHSWGDTIEHAIKNTREAIEGHVSTMIELDMEVNLAVTSIDELRQNEAYAGALWAVVEVDAAKFDQRPERVNISIPRFILAKIDEHVSRHRETRSGFLARAALDAIQHDGKVTA